MGNLFLSHCRPIRLPPISFCLQVSTVEFVNNNVQEFTMFVSSPQKIANPLSADWPSFDSWAALPLAMGWLWPLRRVGGGCGR